MKKLCFLCCLLIVVRCDIRSQSVIERLTVAVATLERDSQLRHGILSFYVADSKTGKPVFEKNSQI
ncbi:MAG TPA: hypothetical protein VFN95_03305, partial [Flavitalea sp.]|nr:hypothetical protein [Flavitalea sp.]